MSKMKLGRGLEAIMSPLTANQNNDSAEKIENISIEKIKPNRHQPRTIFNEEKLQELAESIKEQVLKTSIDIFTNPDEHKFSGENIAEIATNASWAYGE